MWKLTTRKPVLWAVALACLLAPTLRADLPPEDWANYRRAYISAEGRVIDTVNERVSHSEGQGYGMLIAEAAGDAATFDQLWKWTQANLQVRGTDRLLAWRWRPTTPDAIAGKVDDLNNASDGDILVAWALYRASKRWERKDYFEASRALIAEIRTKLLRRNGRAVFLLPAITGFEKPTHTVLNLSYWVFPALRDFAKVEGGTDWSDLQDTGLALLKKARFGDYALPPDWLQVSARTVKPADEFEPLFSYNAIRVPLYLYWNWDRDSKLYEPYEDFYTASTQEGKPAPASLNLNTNIPGPHPTLPGMRHILELATALNQGGALPAAAPLPPGESYYSASLLLLARIAAAEPPRSSTDQLPPSIQLGPALPLNFPAPSRAPGPPAPATTLPPATP